MPGNTPQRLSIKCTAQSKRWIQDSNSDSAVSSKLPTALPSMEAWNKKKSLDTSIQRGQQSLIKQRDHRNNHGSLEPINYLQSIVPQKPSIKEKTNDDGRVTVKNTSAHRPLSQAQRSPRVSPDGIDLLSQDECKSQKKVNKSRNNNNINFFQLSGQDQFSDKKRQLLLPISSAAGSKRQMNDIAHMLNEEIIEYNGESNQTSPFKENTNISTKFTSQTEVHQKSIDSKQSIELLKYKETESPLKHRNALIKSRLSSKERRSRMKERADRFQRFEDEKELDFFSQKEILHAAERIIQDINEEEAERRRQKLFSENLIERDDEERKIVKCNFIQKSALVQLTDQGNFETHVKERMTLLDNIENENYRLKYGLDEKAIKEGIISKNQQISGEEILADEMNVKVSFVQGNDNDPREKLFERLSKQTTESQRIRDQTRRFHRSQQNSRNSSSIKKEIYLEQNSNALEETIKEITSYQKSLKESKKFDDDKRKISQFLSSIFLESEVKGKIEIPTVLATPVKPKFKKFQIVEMPLQKNG